ncbi:hypothetical protein FGB62_282g06 [Gracilaria domingensis]|nr:hypothetical protein FGB62_282g06 [Gracilaria domingensis]
MKDLLPRLLRELGELGDLGDLGKLGGLGGLGELWELGELGDLGKLGELGELGEPLSGDLELGRSPVERKVPLMFEALLANTIVSSITPVISFPNELVRVTIAAVEVPVRTIGTIKCLHTPETMINWRQIRLRNLPRSRRRHLHAIHSIGNRNGGCGEDKGREGKEQSESDRLHDGATILFESGLQFLLGDDEDGRRKSSKRDSA